MIGYKYRFFFLQQNNARVIADSILALHGEDLISNPTEDTHVTTELREQGASLSPGGGANEGAEPAANMIYNLSTLSIYIEVNIQKYIVSQKT